MSEQPGTGLPDETARKLRAARDALRGLGRAVVAFSGGADSTLALALAVEELGAGNVLAATGVSPVHFQADLLAARELAGRLGVELVELPTDEMDNPAFTANTPERCYVCKLGLLKRLAGLAARHWTASPADDRRPAVVTGTNADDAGDYRPGLRAEREAGTVRPLMDAGLTKAEVRAAARSMGLPNWDRPAMACLATRIPYGETLTPARLGRIEAAEEALLAMGFGTCRVRDHGTVARIELPAGDLEQGLRRREQIAAALRGLGYTFVALDLEGLRSGSMNAGLGTPAARARPASGAGQRRGRSRPG